MDIAKCTLDEKTYTTIEFSKLPPNELSKKRRHLICTECQAAVFFRKASRAGQAAFFGALSHIKDCSFASPKTQRLEGTGADEFIVHNPGEIIEVDLECAATTFNLDVDQGVNYNKTKTQAARYLDQDPRLNSRTRQRLGALLIKLVNSKEFRDSNQKIEIEGREPTIVRNFFVSLNDIKCISDEEFHGYWGMLTDARFGSEGSLWLNFGGIGDISCVVPSEIVDAFYSRYKLEDEEDLAGAYILIMGTNRTSQSGKKYIRPDSIDHISVRRINIGEYLSDEFFITKKKKIAFLLKNNEKGVFDEELGIKRKHYVDEKAAKEWRSKLITEFHPDKNQIDTSLNYNEIVNCINKIYKRMVGKA